MTIHWDGVNEKSRRLSRDSDSDILSPETIRFIASATDLDVAVLYRLMVVENNSRRRQIREGRIVGLMALTLMLATVVFLASVGQPWVAAVIGGTCLTAIVAIFVTGRYEPSPSPTFAQASKSTTKEKEKEKSPFVTQGNPHTGLADEGTDNPNQ
jgi:hypothetical protein